MNKIILCLFLSVSFCSVGFSSSTGERCATEERMVAFRMLLNKDIIPAFVRHPNLLEYFIEERQRVYSYLLSVEPDLEALKGTYPENSSEGCWVDQWLLELYKLKNPYPLEEIAMPFFTWGSMCIAYGYSETALEELGELQIKLFKAWFDRDCSGFDFEQGNLAKEILNFSLRYPGPQLSAVLGAYSEILLDFDWDVDDLVEVYSGREEYEKLSPHQLIELEHAYNPVGPLLYPPALVRGLNKAMDERYLDEDEDPLDGRVDEIWEEYMEQKFFSREKVIDLFFEVLIEVCPEHEEFLLNIQRGTLF